MSTLGTAYPWVKSFHLISVFAWMAGMFYLPRLFVYHSKAPVHSGQSEMLKIMERRLLRVIMNPAMIFAWLLGITLVLTPGIVDWSAGWWHAKMAGFLGMTILHGYLSKARRKFELDQRPLNDKKWVMINEAPTALLILIVVMVIAKPF